MTPHLIGGYTDRLERENARLHLENKRLRIVIEARDTEITRLVEALRDTSEALAYLQDRLAVKVNPPTLDNATALLREYAVEKQDE